MQTIDLTVSFQVSRRYLAESPKNFDPVVRGVWDFVKDTAEAQFWMRIEAIKGEWWDKGELAQAFNLGDDIRRMDPDVREPVIKLTTVMPGGKVICLIWIRPSMRKAQVKFQQEGSTLFRLIEFGLPEGLREMTCRALLEVADKVLDENNNWLDGSRESNDQARLELTKLVRK